MSRTYECMFLIDNDAVRAGWQQAKANVASLLEKYGGKVLAARHWAERKLTYSIRHRNRATYMLVFCELPPEAIAEVRRELDISETVLRYLITGVEEVPAKELELAQAEQSADFVLPEPPEEGAEDEEPVEEPAAEAPARTAAPVADAKKEATETEEAKAPEAEATTEAAAPSVAEPVTAGESEKES